jgi:hypothetical protein
MRRISRHLTYANVMVTILAFIVLSGGTAVALSGTDTVQSDDLGPGSQVKAPDVAANAVNGSDVVDNSISGADVNESSLGLAAEPWHSVGSGPGDTVPFRSTARCQWQNFDAGTFNAAAFTRDRSGFVHLKGIVKAVSKGVGDQACGADGTVADYFIFILPPGYRPAQQEVHATLSNHVLGRVNVFGPGASISGGVSFEFPTTWGDAHQWIVLDGISFRCAPAGSNGCP